MARIVKHAGLHVAPMIPGVGNTKPTLSIDGPGKTIPGWKMFKLDCGDLLLQWAERGAVRECVIPSTNVTFMLLGAEIKEKEFTPAQGPTDDAPKAPVGSPGPNIPAPTSKKLVDAANHAKPQEPPKA